MSTTAMTKQSNHEETRLFYRTLLHERVHSTSKPLERPLGDNSGDNGYAREELIAELGSAMVCIKLGISSYVAEHNANDLASWLKNLKEEPGYLMEIVGEVNRATSIILDLLNINSF